MKREGDADERGYVNIERQASEALNRVNMPTEAVERISEMMSPGSSLIISDQPISGETGRDTDFIILTH